MTRFADLRLMLLENERCYVDEIHRLNADPSVQLFPEDAVEAGGGWLYLPAEPGSGDWNIARMLGQGSAAAKALPQLPSAETNLLVPQKFSALFADSCARQSPLIFFEGCAAPGRSRQVAASDLSGIWHELKLQRRTGGADGDFALYLLAEGQIQGYIKSIHLTPQHVEVYIEVQPAMRQRGLGEYLLHLALIEASQTSRSLVYAVDADNAASLALARKVGLQQFLQLDRFLYNG